MTPIEGCIKILGLIKRAKLILCNKARNILDLHTIVPVPGNHTYHKPYDQQSWSIPGLSGQCHMILGKECQLWRNSPERKRDIKEISIVVVKSLVDVEIGRKGNRYWSRAWHIETRNPPCYAWNRSKSSRENKIDGRYAPTRFMHWNPIRMDVSRSRPATGVHAGLCRLRPSRLGLA